MKSTLTENQQFWSTVYNRFELDEPELDPRRRASRMYSPRADILRALKKPRTKEPRRFLLLGTVGTGKTTELFAIADELQSSRFVILLDLWRHFDESVGDVAALQHVEPWEVLMLVALAVYRGAEKQFAHAWRNEQRQSLENAIKAFFPPPNTDSKGPRVDLVALTTSLAAWVGVAADVSTGGAVSAGLSLLSAASKGAKWELPLGRRARPGADNDQDPRVETLLRVANDLLNTVENEYRPAALFIDGLDRIAEHATIRGLFIESRLLARIGCNMVLTGPIALRQGGTAHMVNGLNPKVLANAPVLDRAAPGDPQQHGTGVDFMRDLFELRIRDLPPPPQVQDPVMTIPPPLIARLAHFSGGRARDFVRLIRDVADRSYDADLAVVDADLVDKCIDDYRRVMELGITRADVDLLAEVARDPDHLLPGNPRTSDLLGRFLLLPYPNESEWYFPHPLLTLKLVRLR